MMRSTASPLLRRPSPFQSRVYRSARGYLASPTRFGRRDSGWSHPPREQESSDKPSSSLGDSRLADDAAGQQKPAGAKKGEVVIQPFRPTRAPASASDEAQRAARARTRQEAAHAGEENVADAKFRPGQVASSSDDSRPTAQGQLPGGLGGPQHDEKRLAPAGFNDTRQADVVAPAQKPAGEVSEAAFLKAFQKRRSSDGTTSTLPTTILEVEKRRGRPGLNNTRQAVRGRRWQERSNDVSAKAYPTRRPDRYGSTGPGPRITAGSQSHDTARILFRATRRSEGTDIPEAGHTPESDQHTLLVQAATQDKDYPDTSIQHLPKAEQLSQLLERRKETRYKTVWVLYFGLDEEQQREFRRSMVVYLCRSTDIMDVRRAYSIFLKIPDNLRGNEVQAAGVMLLIKKLRSKMAMSLLLKGIRERSQTGGLQVMVVHLIASRQWQLFIGLWLDLVDAKGLKATQTMWSKIHPQLVTKFAFGPVFIIFEKYVDHHGREFVESIRSTSVEKRAALNGLRRALATTAVTQPCKPRHAGAILELIDDSQTFEKYLPILISRWRDGLESKSSLLLVPEMYKTWKKKFPRVKPSAVLLRNVFDAYFAVYPNGLEQLYNDWCRAWGDLDKSGFERFIEYFATQGKVATVEDLWARYTQKFPEAQTTMHGYRGLLTAYAYAGNREKIEQLMEAITQRGIQPDTASVNTIIRCFIQEGNDSRAYELFEQLRANNACNAESYELVMTMAAHKGDMAAVRVLLDHSQDQSIPVTPQMARALVLVYCRNARATEAEALCQQFSKRDIKDAQLWNMVIRLAGAEGKLTRCYELMQTMRRFGVEWDGQTYEVLLEALAKVHQVQPAYKILRTAQRDKIFLPSAKHYEAVILGAARAGEHEVAIKVGDMMVEAGLNMTLTAHVALLEMAWDRAPKAHRTRALGQGIVDTLRALAPVENEGSRPTYWSGSSSGRSNPGRFDPGRSSPGRLDPGGSGSLADAGTDRFTPVLPGDRMRLKAETKALGRGIAILGDLRQFGLVEEVVGIYLAMFPECVSGKSFPPSMMAGLMHSFYLEDKHRRVIELWQRTLSDATALYTVSKGTIFASYEYVLCVPLIPALKSYRELGDGDGLCDSIAKMTAAGFKLTRACWNIAIENMSESGTRWETAMDWCELMLMPNWRAWDASKMSLEARRRTETNRRELRPYTALVLRLQKHWIQLRQAAAWSTTEAVRLQRIEHTHPALYQAWITSFWREQEAAWILPKKPSMRGSIRAMLAPLTFKELHCLKRTLEMQLRAMEWEEQGWKGRGGGGGGGGRQQSAFHIYTGKDENGVPQTRPLERHWLTRIKEEMLANLAALHKQKRKEEREKGMKPESQQQERSITALGQDSMDSERAGTSIVGNGDVNEPQQQRSDMDDADADDESRFQSDELDKIDHEEAESINLDDMHETGYRPEDMGHMPGPAPPSPEAVEDQIRLLSGSIDQKLQSKADENKDAGKMDKSLQVSKKLGQLVNKLTSKDKGGAAEGVAKKKEEGDDAGEANRDGRNVRQETEALDHNLAELKASSQGAGRDDRITSTLRQDGGEEGVAVVSEEAKERILRIVRESVPAAEEAGVVGEDAEEAERRRARERSMKEWVAEMATKGARRRGGAGEDGGLSGSLDADGGDLGKEEESTSLEDAEGGKSAKNEEPTIPPDDDGSKTAKKEGPTKSRDLDSDGLVKPEEPKDLQEEPTKPGDADGGEFKLEEPSSNAQDSTGGVSAVKKKPSDAQDSDGDKAVVERKPSDSKGGESEVKKEPSNTPDLGNNGSSTEKKAASNARSSNSSESEVKQEPTNPPDSNNDMSGTKQTGPSDAQDPNGEGNKESNPPDSSDDALVAQKEQTTNLPVSGGGDLGTKDEPSNLSDLSGGEKDVKKRPSDSTESSDVTSSVKEKASSSLPNSSPDDTNVKRRSNAADSSGVKDNEPNHLPDLSGGEKDVKKRPSGPTKVGRGQSDVNKKPTGSTDSSGGDLGTGKKRLKNALDSTPEPGLGGGDPAKKDKKRSRRNSGGGRLGIEPTKPRRSFPKPDYDYSQRRINDKKSSPRDSGSGKLSMDPMKLLYSTPELDHDDGQPGTDDKKSSPPPAPDADASTSDTKKIPVFRPDLDDWFSDADAEDFFEDKEVPFYRRKIRTNIRPVIPPGWTGDKSGAGEKARPDLLTLDNWFLDLDEPNPEPYNEAQDDGGDKKKKPPRRRLPEEEEPDPEAVKKALMRIAKQMSPFYSDPDVDDEVDPKTGLPRSRYRPDLEENAALLGEYVSLWEKAHAAVAEMESFPANPDPNNPPMSDFESDCKKIELFETLERLDKLSHILGQPLQQVDRRRALRRKTTRRRLRLPVNVDPIALWRARIKDAWMKKQNREGGDKKK